jgi:hypothetical protein
MLRLSFWLGFLLSACIAAGQTETPPDLVLSTDSVSGSGSVGTTVTLPTVSLSSSNSTPIKLSVMSQRSDAQAQLRWRLVTRQAPAT